MTTCLTCQRDLEAHEGPGRPPAYCSNHCRSVHRSAMKRTQREIIRLERELEDAERIINDPRRRSWAKSARAFFRAKLDQARLDLEALRIGRWPS